MVKITKEQFRAFLKVRESGRTNMFDIPTVVKLAKNMCKVSMTKKEALEMLRNFSQYNKQWGVDE